ncbi:MAG TPA: AMP-binding protein [Alphaproteobacteria bacterium]|jgi:fatty-acyl-CoA synthase|nr:AMP-binding protein [Alphaproteobacteria bacterium]MDP7427660.1 AMP-binding protein [Alphaproteobacteria bacterium]HJM49666.1 AMP-binding protein [Alphaproteobacteria bacterium]
MAEQFPLHQGCSYADLICRAIQRWPERTALVDAEGPVSYGELGSRIARMVAAFAAAGLKRGDALAQISSNRVDAVVVSSAALMAGVRYTPLHPLGSLEDQVFILEDGAIGALVADVPAFAGRGRELAAASSALEHVFTIGPADFGRDLLELAASQETAPLRPVAEAGDVAWLAYTGGTTGRSKGVMLPHRSMVFNALITLAEWQWPRQIRLLTATPITHAAGAMIVPVMLRGGSVVMLPGFEPEGFLAAVEEHRISATFLVPTMIYVLLDHPALKETDISSLEMIIYGAAPMSPSRLVEAMEVFGPVFTQLYAQTEAPNTVTCLRMEDHDPARPDLLASCGSPLAGIQVAILDADDNEVAVGEPGEICVRGPLVMDGYWQRPEETAETLRNGWLHTGDMAKRDEDGFYYIVDRSKDMIISGGFNVFPREIEDVLTSHAEVAMAAVIGVPDEKWGEAVKAIVVPRPGASPSAEELVALVRDAKGPVYAPKTVEFADDLPLTALGKPDKKAIRAAFWGDSERQVH